MRPPLAVAREAATKRLIETHRDDWNAMVDQELAKRGWAQGVVECRARVDEGERIRCRTSRLCRYPE